MGHKALDPSRVMALNTISNIGASIALRALRQADRAMTDSLSKLAAGTRVQSAKDDAAALAIGSRLKAEISAIKTVSVNAAQGVSMLQIAEGAYARANDMVLRMRALASQAASSQLSATERGMLDTEFQALKTEINRLAGATAFNGQQLVNSTFGWSFDDINYMDPQFTSRVSDFTLFNPLPTGTVVTVGDFSNGDLYLILDGISYLHMDFNSIPTDPTTGHTTERYTVPIRFYAGGPATGNGAIVGSITMEAGLNPFALSQAFLMVDPALTITSQSYGSQNFSLGSGSLNNITTNLFGINATSLGLQNANVTTAGNAQAAANAAQYAIDMIALARANVGAAQNRLDAAAANINTMIDNLQQASSAYLDLDIASEMSVFTSKQILVQAGISMIAEANRTPQNLLRLFNGGLL